MSEERFNSNNIRPPKRNRYAKAKSTDFYKEIKCLKCTWLFKPKTYEQTTCPECTADPNTVDGRLDSTLSPSKLKGKKYRSLNIG
jgi:ssDNA-binding Zn-finger/Zn-ribbon topoisomerase 1